MSSWADAWNLESASFSAHTSSGGGRGGYSYSSNNENALLVGPGNAAWGGDGRANNGGLGGRPVPYDADGRMFFGGGGGAGDGNNNVAGAGGQGGGIVIIIASSITGSGSIEANGQAGTATSGE